MYRKGHFSAWENVCKDIRKTAFLGTDCRDVPTSGPQPFWRQEPAFPRKVKMGHRGQSSDGVGGQGAEQVTSCCGLGVGGQGEGRGRWQSSGGGGGAPLVAGFLTGYGPWPRGWGPQC